MIFKMLRILVYSTILILMISKEVTCNTNLGLNDKRAGRGYIDPYSFTEFHRNPEINNQFKNIQPHDIVSSIQNAHNNVELKCLNNRDDIPDELFSRRLINILLNAASFEENDHIITGNVALKLKKSELEKLKSFGLGETSMRDLDSIIDSIFEKPEKFIPRDFIFNLQRLMEHVYFYKEFIITFLGVFYITWIMMTTKWNIFKILSVVIIVLFAASFVITWIQLIKEEEIKIMADQIKFTKLPIHCQPEKMSWWDTLKHLFSSEQECHRYFKSIMENPFFKVTPAQALSHMIAVCVTHPLEMFGKSLGKFVHHLTANISTPVKLILEPIFLVLFPILVIIFLICLFGGSFGWNIGPFRLFSLTGSSSTQSNDECCKQLRTPVEIILKLQSSQDNQVKEITFNSTDQKNSTTKIEQDLNLHKVALEDRKSIENDSSCSSALDKKETVTDSNKTLITTDKNIDTTTTTTDKL